MTSPAVHIYRANAQPATRYIDNCTEREMVFTNSPNKLLPCHACGKRRPAKNLVVQVYYDHIAVWCAEGKGCKDPKLIARKRKLTRLRRSIGQKMRWKRVHERRAQP